MGPRHLSFSMITILLCPSISTNHLWMFFGMLQKNKENYDLVSIVNTTANAQFSQKKTSIEKMTLFFIVTNTWIFLNLAPTQ